MKKILNKKIKRYILLPLFIFMIFTVCVHKCYGQSTARVIKVIDGDTIVIKTFENIIYKIRLIGVDTPETKHPRKGVEYYGPEATAFVKKTLYKKLIIFKTSKNLFDRYGRLLAFIYVDGKLLNLEIIKQGFGYAYLRYKFNKKLMELFAKAHLDAMEKKKGLWK